MTVSIRVDVDDAEYQAALPAAMEEWRLLSYEFIDHVSDKVVSRAQELVAKRTTRLEHTIKRGPLVLTHSGAYIQISAGDGTRYALYQEFGTHKMRAHPYFRPALALAAGLLRGAGYAARVATTAKTRAAVRRAAHRKQVLRAVRVGILTPDQARRESRRISSIRHFRG